LTDEEIEEVQTGRVKDKINDTEVENAGTAESPEGGGEELGGGEEEGGGLFAADKPEGDLLTALPHREDDEDEDEDDQNEDDIVISLSIDDDDAPVKAQNAIMNTFGQPMTKSRAVRGGPDSTNLPDFVKMTSTGRSGRKQDSLSKPYDDDFVKSPFGESTDSAKTLMVPRLTFDLVKTLGHMSSKIGITKAALLSEAADSDFIDDDYDLED